MYQLEIVGTFIAMFSLGIIVLISGFIWTRLEKRKDSKRTPDHFVKVCQNETCKKLSELMIKLMVTRLKFEDETQEISDVKEHLKVMKTQVHSNESDPLLARQEIFQCLRSTLGEFIGQFFYLVTYFFDFSLSLSHGSHIWGFFLCVCVYKYSES